MPLIDTRTLPVIEKKPGWRGRYFDSENMTFGHYEFDKDALIPTHEHEQEEIWHVIEGELEITIGSARHRAGAGFVGIVPPNTRHGVKALSNGKAIVVDYPIREGFSQRP